MPAPLLGQPAQPSVAVLIPCFNEEATIGKVVTDFRASLPHATIYVYDNNSRDRTALEARAAGAVVRHEPLLGKGNVVRRMFADVQADCYFLVDGDDTYDATAAPAMLRLLLARQLDMVTAARVTQLQAAYPRGHRFGNRLLTALVRGVFGDRISDVLSGYRVFSRRFVKSFPALADGFEIETEFTVHALEWRMPVDEVAAEYRMRPPGSQSKLHTLSDGLRILRTILLLAKEGQPLRFFATAGTLLLVLAVACGAPVVMEFLETGLVPRLPSAVLATGLMSLSSLTLVCGLVLDSVERGRKEVKRLAYL
ncbi:MAG TPA: glycosyltransferase family 2 protein, partial [Acetobacteraceae bacterium]|nr:glycosyltransferase family 2 protein [Acetobacteraceae bacterium]